MRRDSLFSINFLKNKDSIFSIIFFKLIISAFWNLITHIHYYTNFDFSFKMYQVYKKDNIHSNNKKERTYHKNIG